MESGDLDRDGPCGSGYVNQPGSVRARRRLRVLLPMRPSAGQAPLWTGNTVGYGISRRDGCPGLHVKTGLIRQGASGGAEGRNRLVAAIQQLQRELPEFGQNGRLPPT